VPVPDSISDYLRTYSSQLGSRILESFPPLHAIDDPPSPMISKLLRKPYPAQTLAIMGLVRRWQQARAGAVIAECGTGKRLISLGAIYTHAEGRPFTAIAMVPRSSWRSGVVKLSSRCPMSGYSSSTACARPPAPGVITG